MPKYVYICSAGHSGSTLLDMLLGSHSRVASLGEIDQLSKNLALNTECSCSVPIRSCPLWSEVIARVGATLDIDILANPYALHMGYPKASRVIDHTHQTRLYLLRRELILALSYLCLRLPLPHGYSLLSPVARAIDNNVRVFDAVRTALNCDMIVDSSKSYLKAVALYQRYPADVRVLLLTRDGRGVLASNLKRGMARAKAIREWRHQYQRALPLLNAHVDPKHLLQVRYEDLSSATSETLQRICAFVGLAFENQMLNFRAKTHHIANGNDIRLASSSEIRSDQQWRVDLTSADLAYFGQRGGALNHRLGYA